MDYQPRQFLAPPSTCSVTKSPSRQHLSLRKSSASLRDAVPSAAGEHLDGGGGGTMVSLAHELAAAMMPEPNLTSQMLAEEFGIDFDDGAEGATASDDASDERRQLDPSPTFMDAPLHAQDEYQSPLDAYTSDVDLLERSGPFSFTASLQDRNFLSTAHAPLSSASSDAPELSFHQDADDAFGPPASTAPSSSLDLLAQNLKATDLFIAQLRSLDMDTRYAATNGKEPSQFLEACTAALVSHLNDAVRDREAQVRQLTEYDREFRKMAAEIGGAELLGNLDQLLDDLIVEDVLSHRASDDEDDVQRTPRRARRSRATHSHQGAPKRRGGSNRLPGLREEVDFDDIGDLEDEVDGGRDDSDDPTTYTHPGRLGMTRGKFHLTELVDDVSISGIFPHLTHLRNVTQSVVNSFTSLSEQAQVNAVRTADVGRKLRALKHKVEELKSDWETADQSRIAIDRWEAGLMNGSETSLSARSSPSTSPRAGSPHVNEVARRIDGRLMVQEQMQGFESTLDEAARKVRVIMSTI